MEEVDEILLKDLREVGWYVLAALLGSAAVRCMVPTALNVLDLSDNID
jgi:hypothetical protein